MGLLQTHGALQQFSQMQGELNRREAEVEALRQRYAAAEQLEGTKTELEIERNRLLLRLRQDFREQKQVLDDAFKETNANFDLQPYILPTRLTDATEDGGLFGIR